MPRSLPHRRAFLGTALAAPLALLPAELRAADASPADVQIVPPDGDGAKFWPRWRGPSGQGIVAPGGYPDKWSDTENVLWKVELPSAGNSSPILWQDRLYLTGATAGGKKRSILCFDRANGKLLWDTPAPDATPEKAQGKNGYASGTPSTDGQHVWAYFGNHGLLCVDAAGKVVWHQPFAEMDAYHGTACSPLLYRNCIIVYQDHRSKTGSFVAAFDKKTGKELWRTPRKEKVGWGSPIAIRTASRDEIIVSSENRVYGYDPATGQELWVCQGNNYEVTPTPAVGHGLVYCCSGRVGPTLAIRPGGSGDVSKSHLAWRQPTGSPFIPSPLLHGDYLYMVNDILSVGRCFEARTGKKVWEERLGPVIKEGFSSSPLAVGDKVYFTNDQGDTFVLAAGPEFKLLHVNKLNARTLATPALLDGKWYWRTDKHLLCIGRV